ncbi:hypothetical protein VIGAN_09024000, partial [Vigna angularis var. angularis]
PSLCFQHFQPHSNHSTWQIGQQADQQHQRQLKQKHFLLFWETQIQRNHHKQSILAYQEFQYSRRVGHQCAQF